MQKILFPLGIARRQYISQDGVSTIYWVVQGAGGEKCYINIVEGAGSGEFEGDGCHCGECRESCFGVGVSREGFGGAGDGGYADGGTPCEGG